MFSILNVVAAAAAAGVSILFPTFSCPVLDRDSNICPSKLRVVNASLSRQRFDMKRKLYNVNFSEYYYFLIGPFLFIFVVSIFSS